MFMWCLYDVYMLFICCLYDIYKVLVWCLYETHKSPGSCFISVQDLVTQNYADPEDVNQTLVIVMMMMIQNMVNTIPTIVMMITMMIIINIITSAIITSVINFIMRILCTVQQLLATFTYFCNFSIIIPHYLQFRISAISYLIFLQFSSIGTPS